MRTIIESCLSCFISALRQIASGHPGVITFGASEPAQGQQGRAAQGRVGRS
jgi:hypothetical protein